MDSPYSVDHAPKGRCNQDLGDVDLAGEDGAVNAKSTLGVPWTVVDVLQEKGHRYEGCREGRLRLYTRAVDTACNQEMRPTSLSF